MEKKKDATCSTCSGNLVQGMAYTDVAICVECERVDLLVDPDTMQRKDSSEVLTKQIPKK